MFLVTVPFTVFLYNFLRLTYNRNAWPIVINIRQDKSYPK
jgi:hypothetical protein